MEALTERKKAVLLDFLDAFLPSSERKEQAFEESLATKSEEEAAVLRQARFEAGVQMGIEKGLNFVYGALLKLAKKRIKDFRLDHELDLRRIKDFRQLEDLAVRILDISTWKEWMKVTSSQDAK